MTEVLLSSGDMSTRLDEDLAKVRESLRTIDDGIRSLSNRFEYRQNFQQFGNGFRGFPPAGAKRRISEEISDEYRPSAFKRLNLGSQKYTNRESSDAPDVYYDDNLAPAEYGKQSSQLIPKPVIASSVSVTLKPTKSRGEAIAEISEQEQGDVKKRNRRMFGLLLGTLQQFKREEDDKGRQFREQERRQKDVERKLEEAKRKEWQDLKQEREKLISQRRDKQRELGRLQRKKAIISSNNNQIELLERLRNFIQTNTKPPIFFLPAKHTIRTIELQKKSQRKLDAVIKRKKEELDVELKLIDDSAVEHEGNEDEIDGLGANKSLRSAAVVKSTATNGDDNKVDEHKRRPWSDDSEREEKPAKGSISEKTNTSSNDQTHERLLREAAEGAEDFHLVDDGVVEEHQQPQIDLKESNENKLANTEDQQDVELKEQQSEQ